MVQSRIGSLCSGSHRPWDIIPSLLAELHGIAGDAGVSAALRDSDLGLYLHYATFQWIGDDAEAYSESEDAMFDLRSILDTLNEHAESFTYYGTHEGDGSDYGCWPDWRAIEDAIHCGELLSVSDLSEIPEDYSGAALLVNDHGNATLYSVGPFNGGQVLQEQWAIV